MIITAYKKLNNEGKILFYIIVLFFLWMLYDVQKVHHIEHFDLKKSTFKVLEIKPDVHKKSKVLVLENGRHYRIRNEYINCVTKSGLNQLIGEIVTVEYGGLGIINGYYDLYRIKFNSKDIIDSDCTQKNTSQNIWFSPLVLLMPILFLIAFLSQSPFLTRKTPN